MITRERKEEIVSIIEEGKVVNLSTLCKTEDEQLIALLCLIRYMREHPYKRDELNSHFSSVSDEVLFKALALCDVRFASHLKKKCHSIEEQFKRVSKRYMEYAVSRGRTLIFDVTTEMPDLLFDYCALYDAHNIKGIADITDPHKVDIVLSSMLIKCLKSVIGGSDAVGYLLSVKEETPAGWARMTRDLSTEQLERLEYLLQQIGKSGYHFSRAEVLCLYKAGYIGTLLDLFSGDTSRFYQKEVKKPSIACHKAEQQSLTVSQIDRIVRACSRIDRLSASDLTAYEQLFYEVCKPRCIDKKVHCGV